MLLIPPRLRIVTDFMPWAFAFILALGLCGCEATPRTEPLPPTPAPIVSPIREGESNADYRKRVTREAQLQADAAVMMYQAEADARIAKIEADARVSAAQAKEDARSDFLESVRTWTGWSMGLLALVGVAALVLSFLPMLSWLGFDFGDSAKAFGMVAGLGIARYILLRYGLLVGDIAAWALIAALIVSAVVVAVMLGKTLVRSKIFTQAKVLEAKGHTSEAVALLATAKGKTGEGVLDKQWRKARATT